MFDVKDSHADESVARIVHAVHEAVVAIGMVAHLHDDLLRCRVDAFLGRAVVAAADANLLEAREAAIPAPRHANRLAVLAKGPRTRVAAAISPSRPPATV